MISASRAGFVAMHAGQKRPNDRGTYWDVAPGQVQQLDFALPRGSVIFGRLTDDAGEPLAGIHVTILRVFYSGNGARLRPWTSMPYTNGTDDRGEFRVAGLSARHLRSRRRIAEQCAWRQLCDNLLSGNHET